MCDGLTARSLRNSFVGAERSASELAANMRFGVNGNARACGRPAFISSIYFKPQAAFTSTVPGAIRTLVACVAMNSEYSFRTTMRGPPFKLKDSFSIPK
jgi:hypothetical protein